MSEAGSAYQRIYAVVRKIPRGRVATYGQIATIAGLPGHARRVGYALFNLKDGERVPWHRVINARGEVSVRSGSDHDELQRILLKTEGVVFDERGRVDLERFLWEPVVAPRSRKRARRIR